MSPTEPVHDHLVHDAVGPPLGGVAAAACLAVGVNALLVLGVLPVLLGALADEHRLGAAGIGQTATLELLAMGLSTAAMGLVRRPSLLRWIGVAASVGLAGADLATLGAAGAGILIWRALAGGLEGILLWITVGMISRTVTPERWAGVFFTAQVLAQLGLAIGCAAVLIPRFGSAGGFAALAGAALLGAAPALALPRRFAPLPLPPGQGGAPSARGGFALIATLVYVSGGGAVAVYLQPIAEQMGLNAGVARDSLWISLAAQVAGGVAATALAGRIRYFTVFLITTATYLAVWALFATRLPAGLFILANAASGLVGLFLGPFLAPMTIDADPSRRAAMQSGAAQLLGGALGPWLASLVVGERDVHGVLWLGAGLILTGLAAVAGLRATATKAAISSRR